MTTIFEALQNANYNLKTSASTPFVLLIAKTQLNNAVVLLEKGYGLHDYMDSILDQYEDITQAPDKK